MLVACNWEKLGKINFDIFSLVFFVQNHRIQKSALEFKMSPAQQQILKYTGTSFMQSVFTESLYVHTKRSPNIGLSETISFAGLHHQ